MHFINRHGIFCLVKFLAILHPGSIFPFITGNKELDDKFIKEAKKVGIENIRGHRTVGGMRASIYNAMPIEGVKYLVEFMKKFEEANK